LNRFNKYLALWIIIPVLIIVLYSLFDQKPESAINISYTEFLGMVDAVDGRRFKVFTPKDSNLIMILKQKGVSIQAIPPDEATWYMSLLISGLPMFLLIGVWIYFMRQMQSGGGKAMSFGKSRARIFHASDAIRRRQGHVVWKEPCPPAV